MDKVGDADEPQALSCYTPKPAGPAVVAVAKFIENTIGRYNPLLVAAVQGNKDYGRYTSNREMPLLLELASRNLWGLCSLARTDLDLLPPGMSLARVILESATNAAWVMHPEQPFEREVRWLRLLEDHAAQLRKAINHSEATGGDANSFRGMQNRLSVAAASIREIFPGQRSFLNKLPPMPERLRELEAAERYVSYVRLSDWVHGGRDAYSRLHAEPAFPFAKGFEAYHWREPLLVGWSAFVTGARAFLRRMDADPEALVSDGERQEAERLFGKLREPTTAEVKAARAARGARRRLLASTRLTPRR